MKTSAIIRIILFSLLILSLVAVMVGGILLGSVSFHFFEGGLTDGIVSSEGSFPASEIQDLDIRWIAGSVTIQTDPSTSLITIQETGSSSEADTMIYRRSRDELTIQYHKAEVFFGFSFDGMAKDLVITVPEDWHGRIIQISSVSANIKANDLSVDQLELENVSGTCRFTNCYIQHFEAETVSGSIEATGSIDTVSLETVSADCTLTLDYGVRSIKTDSVSGELTVYLPDYQGFTAQIDSVSGSFDTDLNTTIDGESYIHGDGSCQIEADSISGDLSILERRALADG